MSRKATASRRSPTRTAPTLSRTSAGRRSFVLRLVHDRACRAARTGAPKA
jgi:hypothetical protein